MFILNNTNRIKLAVFLTIVICSNVFSQNSIVTYSYTNALAKLEGDLRNEFGEKTTIYRYTPNSDKNEHIYMLFIDGKENLKSFIERKHLFTDVRILYLKKITLDKSNAEFFKTLKKLRGLELDNVKVNLMELSKNLKDLDSLKLIRFYKMKIKNWSEFLNKQQSIEHVMIDNCRLDDFVKINSELIDFEISNIKRKIDLKQFLIKEAKDISFENCKIFQFPLGLAATKGLESIGFESCKILEETRGKIYGFENLNLLFINNTRFIFNRVEFVDNSNLSVYIDNRSYKEIEYSFIIE